MTRTWYVTQKKYAEIRGVSAQRINTLVKKGVLKLTKKGLINVVKSNEILDARETLDKDIARHKKSESDGPKKSITEIRQEQEEIRLKQMQLEYQKEIGEVVNKDEIINDMKKILSVAKTKWMAMPAKLAPILAGIDNPKEIQKIIQDENINILTELAQVETYEPNNSNHN